jgi:predicted dehydrogenase
MHQHSQISRRSLLKTFGAAGACALPYLVPSRALAGEGANRKLNLALFGCGGRMGQILGSALQRGDNVVAICDVDTRQITHLKKAFGAKLEKVKVYEDYRKLLESEKTVDAVVIAAGQRWHVPMSKAAMLAGKHVFCEKPLAHSCAEAREIRELGRHSKLATQLGSQGGSTDTFRRSMEVIQAGLLGKIR